MRARRRRDLPNVLPLAGYDMRVMVMVHVDRAMHYAHVTMMPVGPGVKEAARKEYGARDPGTPEHRMVVRPPPRSVHHVGVVVIHVDHLGARLDHDRFALLDHVVVRAG